MDHEDYKQEILIINQLFDLQRKWSKIPEAPSVDRNFKRIEEAWEKLGFSFHDPTGETYDETRTDCEASITGDSSQSLQIIETLKPIIRYKEEGFGKIIQRAVVIAGSA